MPRMRPVLYESITDTAGMLLPGRWSETTIANHWFGGFYTASMRYDADSQYLEELLRYLGKRLDVFDVYRRLAWQGMLSEVEIHEPNVVYSYALDDLANAVMVVYSEIEGTDADAGYRSETSWATDTASIAQYGQKELVLSIAGATDADAQLRRDRYLSLYSRLMARRNITEGGAVPYAIVRCRGYWWTCTWRVWNEDDVADVATNTQIENIVDGVCPFIASRTVVATGNSVSQHRDANQTAWQEILRLMSFGDSSNNPLVCQVWDGRAMQVATLPTAPLYRKGSDGRYMDSQNNVFDPWMLRAGQMLRVGSVLPGAPTLAEALDDPRNMLLQQVTYQEKTNQLTLTPVRMQDLAGLILGTLEPWE